MATARAVKTPSQRGRMSRTKGASFEREVAEAFRAIWPEAKRGVLQWRSGSEVPDVDVPGFWLECKRGRRTNPRAALQQATLASQGTGRIPMAVCRDDRADAFVTLQLDDLLDILSVWRAKVEE